MAVQAIHVASYQLLSSCARSASFPNSRMGDGVPFFATTAPSQANPVHHTLGKPTERGVGPPVLVNSPGQRTTNDHYLTTKHIRECPLTQIRTLDLAFSVKESNKYWYLQAIEVSAAKERGEGRRGQEPRVWQRNGSGEEHVCAEKERDGAAVCANTSSEREPTTTLFGECRCCSQP